jgi:dihydrolipoamide dehydrogenase
MSTEYDVIVIGGGPAGYPAAIRAAQNKLKVACIDEWKNKDGTAVFGGTCTNAGCIPSKALLESSELYHKTKDELGVHGINVSGVSFDVAQMQKRKTGIVKASTTGIAMLLRSAGVTALQGHGKLLANRKVEFTAHDGKKQELTGKHIVLASGSIPTELKSMPFDGKNIVDSWGALDFEAVPKKLAVVGAGVIGLELGSVWRRLGAEVVVLEALDTFLPMADQGLAKEAARHFKKQGLDIKLGAKVSGAKVSGSAVELSYADS